MGFPTMKKAIVEGKLADDNDKEKFFNDVKAKCGPNLAKLNECKKLAALAINDVKTDKPKDKIFDAYMKVGVVDGKLVFRVKHKKGHYGKADIVLAENYGEGHGDVEVKDEKKAKKGENLGLMDTSAKNPALTAAWWRKARGKVTDQGLEKILVEYESAVGDLSNGQNFTHHNAMVAAVDKLASAGLNAYKVAQSYKNDEAIMRAFLALVKDAKTYAYDKHARYKEAVETQVKINQDDMRGIFKVERLDTLIKEVVGLIKTPTKKNVSDADGNFLGIRANLANAKKAIQNYKRKDPHKSFVDDADVKRLEGNSLQQIQKEELKELLLREKLVAQLETQVDSLVKQMLADDAKAPKDPEYAKILNEVIGIYDKVTEDIKAVIPEGTRATNNARKVVVPTRDQEIQATLVQIGAELKKLKEVRDKSAQIFSSTRAQGEGSTKAKNLKEEDLIYTRKRTTEAKMENRKVNGECDKGVEYLKGILDQISKLSGASGVLGDIAKLNLEINNQLQQMNAF